MPLAFPSLKPIRFEGTAERAYAATAISRGAILLRCIAVLSVLAALMRLLAEAAESPGVLVAVAPYRFAGMALGGAVLAVSFVPGFGRFQHLAAGVLLAGAAVLMALANALSPLGMPNVMANVWTVMTLYSGLPFGVGLLVLEAVLGVSLPVVLSAMLGGSPFPPPVLLVLGVFVPCAAVAFAYVQDQHWRKAFLREIDLAEALEQLRRSHLELSTAYATLKTTQAQLVLMEKSAALGRMVAGLAHRISTPVGNLVAVSSHMDGVIRSHAARLAAGEIRRSQVMGFVNDMAEGNAIVVQNAQATAGVIETFRQLAADTGAPGALDLGTFLAGIRPQLAVLAPPNVRLALEAGTGLVVMAHPHVMETVVTELVRNAAVHAFPGKRAGTITVKAGAPEGGGVELRVVDDGIGIPGRHLAHVFDPFYTDGKVGGGGFGLGLSIVHNAVAGPLGGRITLESREGEGTAVTVVLPAAQVRR